MKILLVEDEPKVVEFIKKGLEEQGYETEVSYDGQMGERLALKGKHDLIILDVILPYLNGYELCKRIREKGLQVPVLMLTALGTTDDKISGFDAGADDYLVKPFEFAELLARIKAVFRRVRSGSELPEVYRIGNLEINFKEYQATKNGKSLKLSPREYELLSSFIKRQGEIISRDELLNQIWGYDSFPNTRTVDAHIAKLRQKIEDNPEDPKLIITVHGIGYKLL